jgi:hypothetical protein
VVLSPHPPRSHTAIPIVIYCMLAKRKNILKDENPLYLYLDRGILLYTAETFDLRAESLRNIKLYTEEWKRECGIPMIEVRGRG